MSCFLTINMSSTGVPLRSNRLTFFQKSWHCGHLQTSPSVRPLGQTSIAGGDPHKNTALEEATNVPRVLLASNHMGMASPSLLFAIATQNILHHPLTRQPCLWPPCLRHLHRLNLFTSLANTHPSHLGKSSRAVATSPRVSWENGRISKPFSQPPLSARRSSTVEVCPFSQRLLWWPSGVQLPSHFFQMS